MVMTTHLKVIDWTWKTVRITIFTRNNDYGKVKGGKQISICFENHNLNRYLSPMMLYKDT